MFEKIKEAAKNVKFKAKYAIAPAAAGGSGIVMAVVASAADETGAGTTFSVPLISESITTGMMSGIMAQITSLLPVILPVLVGVLAFRKGLSFFIGMIRGL
jgi:hypothetical protein